MKVIKEIFSFMTFVVLKPEGVGKNKYFSISKIRTK